MVRLYHNTMNYDNIITFNVFINIIVSLILFAMWINIRIIRKKICGVDIKVVKLDGEGKL